MKDGLSRFKNDGDVDLIAESMAEEGCNLIISARSEDKLIKLKVDLQKKHNISVDVFPMSLILLLSD